MRFEASRPIFWPLPNYKELKRAKKLFTGCVNSVPGQCLAD